jgi:phosphoenolpyruvate-protein phosphotransferase (PTS system enzyme I)
MKDNKEVCVLKRYSVEGLATSSGVGIGPIYIFHHEKYKLDFGHIGESGLNHQLKRLDGAITKTIKEILSLKDQLKDRLEENEKFILNVYKTILEDEYFINEIKNIIKIQKLYADNAVEIGFNNYIKEIDISGNEHIKQRIYDLNELKERLIKNIIGGSEPALDDIHHKHIVAVKEITPTLAAVLGKKKIMGILAEEGGTYFSHAAIILRGLGIPLINNINYINIQKYENSEAIIDGYEGVLIIHPDINEIEHHKEVLKRNIKGQRNLTLKRRMSTNTRDGQIIKILANIGDVEDCSLAKEKNVDGIGLVRTEILFVAKDSVPDEREQFATYLKIVKKMRNKPIVFRTIDFGGDKLPQFAPEKFMKSDIELRGIRRSLLYKDDLIKQLRCILQVARYGEIGITFPMVYNANEIRQAKVIIQKILLELQKTNGRAFKEIKIGAFIETLEAFENLDAILKEVNFINIGTNDLFKLTVGSNKLNRSSNDSEYLEPEFLRILKSCISKAKKKKKQIIICGEMAADPLAVALLIGMGASELSLAPAKAVEVRAAIGKLNSNESKKLCDSATRCSSVLEVKKILSEWILRVGRDKNV